jgi:LytR cell envelope-related transcriptional attenuator
VEISDLFDRFGGYVSLAALAGVLLLVPLYLSQRRDVHRLRAWMAREPDHPTADVAASEVLLDRAETELEQLLGTPEPEPETGETSAATRVTHERPALERITMERAALEPHPRWRRFVGRATQPRVLVAIGVAALLLGGGAIYASEELLSNDDSGTPAHAGSIDPAEITVAILNGTSVNGLAGKVGSDVASSGFKLGAVTNTTPGFAKTEVLYAKGQKRAAQKVAKDLGIHGVKRVDPDSRKLAGGADVIVIAGEDRARA